MKYSILAAALICFGFISCKKDRTCNCSITTSGTNTVRNQTAGNSVSLPGGLPTFTLVAPTDTTVVTPYSFTNTQKTSYTKVSTNTMHKNCPASSTENFNDHSVVITPGTSTVSTTKVETKTYTCKIE